MTEAAIVFALLILPIGGLALLWWAFARMTKIDEPRGGTITGINPDLAARLRAMDELTEDAQRRGEY